MDLIDTHCHLDVAIFDPDRQEILQHCQQLGITTMVIPAIHRESWDYLLRLCESHRQLHPALGLHPMFMSRHKKAHLADLKNYAKQHELVAIGEIGLDFYCKESDPQQQQYFFEAQLAIATELKLPVILHVRKAHDATLKILKQQASPHGGTVHAFNGSLQQAEQYIALGFKLGFGGMLTYARSTKLRQLARQLPLEAIVLETDAPDMVVANHRGERNSPVYLIECLSALAEVRQLPTDIVAQQTSRNAKAVLPRIA